MNENTTCRIGIGGPVGSGKTALIEAITPRLLDMGYKVLVITNDVVTTEDAKHVRKMLKGILVEERIIGVETGACPHTAVREDPYCGLLFRQTGRRHQSTAGHDARRVNLRRVMPYKQSYSVE